MHLAVNYPKVDIAKVLQISTWRNENRDCWLRGMAVPFKPGPANLFGPDLKFTIHRLLKIETNCRNYLTLQ